MNVLVKSILAGLMTILTAVSCPAEVRQPVVAGLFYPDDSVTLSRSVQAYLRTVDVAPQIDGELLALIVPHAGHVYSGQIAAHAYSLLRGKDIDNVVLCGPSHRYPFRGVSVYGPGVKWATPLGLVPCNGALCSLLIADSRHIDVIAQAHAQEHALEVQLPFLQAVAPDAAIVPSIMGGQDAAIIDELAAALSKLPWDNRSVMIASTDWQHYKPASQGWTLDSLGIACISQLDPDRLVRNLASRKVEACGGGPAAAVIKAAMARGGNRAVILKYGDSGDISGDKSSVVGYLAAAIYRVPDEVGDSMTNDPEARHNVEPGDEEFLSTEEKKLLLKIARESILSYLKMGEVTKIEVPENLKAPGAAFVTLKSHGRLRGCIGHTVAVKPLHETVSYCGIQAAVNDPRFEPVRVDELDDLEIEISVLTPLQEVSSLDEIEVGRDGLLISRGRYRGLLLPQVPTEQGWNKAQFLAHTCRKAGLPVDAYKSPDVTIQKFQAVIFSESELLHD